MAKYKEGLHYNVSFEDYVKIDAVNNSTLKYLTDLSPAHCKNYIDNGREETPSLAFGKAADCFILEPSLFHKQYVVGPDARRNSKEWKAFEETTREGVEILKPAEYKAILDIYEKVSQSAAMRLIENGQSQVVCIWTDEETGLLCKARWDYFQEGIPMITDLKTTRSAKPEWFAKDVFKYGYYQQAGFYCDGYKAATGETIEPCFAFFAVEKEPPYVATAFDLHINSIEAGRMAYRRAIRRYKNCLENDYWPPYSESIIVLDMPHWALTAAGFGPERMP